MKYIFIAALAFSLMGCNTVSKMTPEQTQATLKAFYDAGCGGKVDLDAGAASGQLGGEAHIALGIHGSCPVRDPASPSPIPQ